MALYALTAHSSTRPMPRRAKSKLGPPKRRRGAHLARACETESASDDALGGEAADDAASEPVGRFYAEERFEAYADLAWHTDYAYRRTGTNQII